MLSDGNIGLCCISNGRHARLALLSVMTPSRDHGISSAAAERRSSAGDLGLDEARSTFSDDWDSMLSDGNIALDPDLLPFPRGRFSFGVGVNLKMAVSRWTNWAADVGLREENMGAEEGWENLWHICISLVVCMPGRSCASQLWNLRSARSGLI